MKPISHSSSDLPSDEDRLMESILHEQARAGNADDEAFLARLDAALNAADTIDTPSSEKPRPSIMKPLLRVLGIAAVIMLIAVLSRPAMLRQRKEADMARVSQVPEGSRMVPLRTSLPPELIEGTPKPIILPGQTASRPAAPVTSQPILRQEIAELRKEIVQTRSVPRLAMPKESESNRGVGRFGDPPPSDPVNRERYNSITDNGWQSPNEAPLSTFSIDVDTASYSNLRRMVASGASIAPDAVRVEEMINYFDYAYPQPNDGRPFAVHLANASCPWSPDHQLVRVALKGQEIQRTERAPANLVFLLDVSGSMDAPNKLPLVKESFLLLLEEMNASDTVSIIVYAGAEGLALPPTSCDEAGRRRIESALNNLKAGGSTNGGAGIQLAYQMARDHFKNGGINRVILATDGDFNVGVTGDGGLVRLVEENAKSNVFLSVLGFGEGNLNDGMLEAITNKGNGTYYYIDTIQEARRVFLQKMMGTLVTIAKDVKIQVEFNPAQVKRYRLLGYANRMLRKDDFVNDKIDAGDIGAGHTVTAFYEIETGDSATPAGETLRYARPPAPKEAVASNGNDNPEWLTVKLRYKQPEGDRSALIEQPYLGQARDIADADRDFRFATSVAMTGMLLRGAEGLDVEDGYNAAAQLAQEGLDEDAFGLRAEFLSIVRRLAARR